MKELSPRAQIVLSMLIFGTIGLFRRWIPFPSSVVALARSVIGLLFLLRGRQGAVRGRDTTVPAPREREKT